MSPKFQSDTTNSEIHVLQGDQYPSLQLVGQKGKTPCNDHAQWKGDTLRVIK